MAMPIRISQKNCTLYIGRQVSNVHNVTCLKVSLCLMVDGVFYALFLKCEINLRLHWITKRCQILLVTCEHGCSESLVLLGHYTDITTVASQTFYNFCFTNDTIFYNPSLELKK